MIPLSGRLAVTGLVVVLASMAYSAHAENPFTSHFTDGNWRAELTITDGVYSGKIDRHGDLLVAGSVEYEWPVFARAVLGLKAYPLFLYLQETNDEGESDTIHGAAVGLSSRFFLKEEERKGFYGELGASLVWHSRYLEGNTSRLNFMTEMGVGYEFHNDWHVAIKWEHISNSGMTSRNAGANGIGLSFGYSF